MKKGYSWEVEKEGDDWVVVGTELPQTASVERSCLSERKEREERQTASVERSCLREEKRQVASGREELFDEREKTTLTMYKRKKDKVRPVNTPHRDGLKPERRMDWKHEKLKKEKEKGIEYEGQHANWLIAKFSTIEKGTRLTEERMKEMKLPSNFAAEEMNLLEEMLFNREAVFAWDWAEKGKLDVDIEPPHKIPTISHEPWQAPSFRIPKALDEEVREILQ